MTETETPPSLTALTTYLLSRVGKDARGRIAARLARRELRMWHMAVLAALADFGPHAQRDLGARLSIDPSDMTKILDELVARGHVDRTRDPRDRRRFSVAVSPSGVRELARLTAEARAVQDEVLAPLDARERERLHALLAKVFAHRDVR
ncbi:winged helix-turn-helix transcriptional regulator [Streptomyces sp. AV19]|uniref:MarR family winged helix-turn-helix transcriptional regulator n=1 Tax=Streptomyces sp. AV19 TaxID=2793068 RepID=UPI0018FF0175|nr:MarR family winged helix-turn-helix transcriptional regulator [Streptomyces sp. AV19]MBH1937363.1 winged helix-turn-helix transcriptional regulator [Streptomyces sp. AV19]MDG4533907.1 MarR family winged helix-turn-helix transcriptional regulator [Streptomyces sp. AV19]